MSSYDTRPDLYDSVDRADWDDWHWQQRNRIRTLDELERVVSLTAAERTAFADAAGMFRVAITPYYAGLVDSADPECPIRLQCVPQRGELVRRGFELADPLAEETHMPVPGVTHRYPDRVLLYATHNCPVYCRHCTRKRKVADPSTATSRTQLAAAIDYVRRAEEVRDVLVSGGDPLTLSNELLDWLFDELTAIEHLDVVRLGTRNPVTLPQRIDDGLCETLERRGPIYLHTHFNHPKELTGEAAAALDRLRRAGCVLGNQMVLLRRVNDDADTVLRLNRGLLRAGCRPYYMLQCDMAEGITHFRTPLERGVDIVDRLRGRIGGMGIPDFVVDLPGGGGKVELTPDYVVDRDGDEVTFRNWRGDRFVFHDVDGA